MKLAVTDANIFIDLHHSQLTANLFSIDLTIYTTLEVFDELNGDQQLTLMRWAKTGEFIIHKFEITDLDALENFNMTRKLSFTDHTVIYLAEQLKSIVLSGDNKLKKACLKRNIKAHGILWVFDQFILKQLITRKHALEKLKALMQFNKWLPLDECNKRINDWT